MKQIIITILVTITLTSCGETAKQQISNDIKNVKNAKHVNIPGTKLYMIPPANFKIATNFVGLQKDDNTGIQIYDLVDGSFYTNAATISREKFENKGAKVFDYSEFTINGYPAKYTYMQGNKSSKAYQLAFGDSTYSVMLMAIFPVDDEEASKQIKESLLSVVYDKNLKIDPIANATFKLDDNVSKFKFAKSSASLYLYSIGGINKPSYDNEPLVTVTQLPVVQSMTLISMSDEVISSLEKYGLTDKEIKNKSFDKINGYNAFESEVYGNMKGQKSLIYLLVVVSGQNALVIQGIAKSDFATNIEEFKKISHTLKFK